MRILTPIVLGVLSTALVAGPAAAIGAAESGSAPGGGPDALRATLVAEFPAGEGGAFAESMAEAGHGTVIVSVTTWGVEDGSPDGWAPNTGQLWRVRPDGSKVRYGPQLDLSEYGLLTGVAIDERGRVFVGIDNFGAEYYGLTEEEPAAGVLRVTPGGAQWVMTLPLLAMPNGVEVVDNSLYVADSYSGVIWKGPTGRRTTPADPWLTSADAGGLLDRVSAFGANGIAYRNGALYVGNSDLGTIVRVPIGRKGSPGTPTVFARSPLLMTADGVEFDGTRLWVTTFGDDAHPAGLVTVSAHGRVAAVRTPDGSLDYPTDVVVIPRGVLVANGAYLTGTPNVTAFRR